MLETRPTLRGCLGALALACVFALPACESLEKQAASGPDADCIDRAPATGSNMLRRDKTCVALTPQQREQAREELDAMRQRQAQDAANRMAGPSGR